MSTNELVGDGSAEADAIEPVVVDRRTQKWRWRCPNGHSNWSRTNNHIWCESCLRENEHGEDVDPEHYHLLDAKENRLVPWTRVELEA
jgi:hypothetical protein